MDLDNKTDELKQTLIDHLNAREDKVNACLLGDPSFVNHDDTKFFEDYSKALNKECTVLKAIDKLRERCDKLNSQIEDIHRAKQQTQQKIDTFKLQYADIEKKEKHIKERSDKIEKICDLLGFRVEQKEDDVYMIEFSDLPIKDREMKFRFEILDNNNKLKVLRCEPPQCLDMTDIETEVNLLDENTKFFKMICLIRLQLITNYQN